MGKLQGSKRGETVSLPYKYHLIQTARNLRKNATEMENKLWYDFLRTYPVRFQRQKVIDGYIADFYCFKARLVIELDGEQHYTAAGMEYDEIRTDILNAYSLEVIRFSNREVKQQFVSVCQAIDRKVKERLCG